MTPLLGELKDALQWRLDVVTDRDLFERDPGAHLEKLKTASETVDRLVRELPADTDPMLRHYLERQSYVKALDWLKEQPATTA